MSKKKKVAVAMSGGVDSGVAAALLIEQGYDCAGFHLHLWHEPSDSEGETRENKCCSTESLEAARKTAHLLGMPFYTLDLADFFKKEVVDYFLKTYGAGLTPNPCVVCNQKVKFGRLFDYVIGLGYDFLATGHYARIKSAGKNYSLLAGVDLQKDQSYFLYNLTQKHLSQVLFPVGEYQKKEVWPMAKKWRLPVADRPESQEICFFPETDYRFFLSRRIPQKIKPGKVVDLKGKLIGQHLGLPLYTIGQRHGFEISDPQVIGPLYVIGKKAKQNLLVVGFGQETETKEFGVRKINWISGSAVKEKTRVRVRIRHQGGLLPSQLFYVKKQLKVILEEANRGIAPGQSVVFYRGERVLGGGVITT